MKLNDTVYITGHMHPDSDSIISAIAYAQLKQRQGISAVACRLGDLNSETTYLLQRFGMEEPMLFEDARATLEEIEIDEPLTITPQTTIYETLELMNETNKQSYGVVNERGQLMGMVTKSDLATVGLGDTAFSIQLLKETPVANIAKTINGDLVYEAVDVHFNGKVSVIAIADTKLLNYELQDRLVIVGNDREAQEAAMLKGAAILIVVWTQAIDSAVIELAKQCQCSIIISGHGTMNTSRYLFFSPPVKLLMKTNLISFNINEFVADVGKRMMKTRFRSYPVIDNDDRLCGYISRFHILNSHNKKVILVDHNEYSQSVKGVEEADVLEVIDHHRVCGITTNRPISFRNEIIGSTAAIIASLYMENQMSIPKDIAGLLLGAILSDTLKFKSPTTTGKDRGIAKALADIAQLDIDVFAKEMFQVSSSIHNKTMHDLIHQDVKKFKMDEWNVMIGQVIVFQIANAREIEEELRLAMEDFAERKELDLFVMTFSSVLENGSIFYAVGKKADVVKEAFPDEEGEAHSFHEGVLSRKNQIVPMLSRAILNSH